MDNQVKFGTSGIRGLVTELNDKVCYFYTLSFLQYLRSINAIQAQHAVGIGGDLRHSTPRIMNAVAAAVVDAGYHVINCGLVPTPALSLFGLAEQIPTIMVTGSHIPEDRNGIKFNKPDGEVLKQDEQGILAQSPSLNEALFNIEGRLIREDYVPALDRRAERQYVARYVDFFADQALAGFKIGVYQHSSVGRDLWVQVLLGLGAEVVALGRSEHFISVDTEAIRVEDIELAAQWSAEYQFDCLVSTDGDADRPLVSDQRGEWLRGDVAGILVARFLQADAVVTPVSSNSALEKSGYFSQCVRTRIGSPYVIAAMQTLTAPTVVGYEANGGFLMQTPVQLDGRTLAALPTRDAFIVPLCILAQAKRQGVPISQLLASLPERFTYSDRIKAFPTELSQSILARLNTPSLEHNAQVCADLFANQLASAVAFDYTDGVRISLANDEVVHLRGSGNAPELRCYTEAHSEARAQQLNQLCMGYMHNWKC